jgi:hypothetical protein
MVRKCHNPLCNKYRCKSVEISHTKINWIDGHEWTKYPGMKCITLLPGYNSTTTTYSYSFSTRDLYVVRCMKYPGDHFLRLSCKVLVLCDTNRKRINRADLFLLNFFTWILNCIAKKTENRLLYGILVYLPVKKQRKT